MQMAWHDAEPAALPGCRDGAVRPPAVDLRGVYKHFGPVQAVRGVALTIGSGEVMAFLGPNGALWLAIFVAGAVWSLRRDTARV